MLMEKHSTTPTGKRRSTPHCGKYCMVVLTFVKNHLSVMRKKNMQNLCLQRQNLDSMDE